jgi:UDP-N-acetylglucosamine--N-acetylmuramyl-(pentapeptide) pyrophosphoryl-undecaprenol N-acetylglucosamine transferase
VAHRVLLTGGGTGGHIYPALAVAECLKADPEIDEILYVGAHGHLEERLTFERGIRFVGLQVHGLPRSLSTKIFTWPVEFAAAVMHAHKLIRVFKPTVVLGTGGYASAAPLLAALLNGIPYAIHEPDAHPGLVNRVFSRQAHLVSLGMDGALDRLRRCRGKVIVNGNPVRGSLLSPVPRDSACVVLGLSATAKTVLVTGGSQGAKALNDAIAKVVPELLANGSEIQIIHQVGANNYDAFKQQIGELGQNPRYLVRPYFDELAIAYAASDLVICRAGAMTIAELSVMGKPAIFIPLPTAAADHQSHNAHFVAGKEAAVVLPQDRLTASSLKEHVLALLMNDARLAHMQTKMLSLGKPRAASDLAGQIKEVSLNYLKEKFRG